MISINWDNGALKVDFLLEELEFRKIGFDIFLFQTFEHYVQILKVWKEYRREYYDIIQVWKWKVILEIERAVFLEVMEFN